MAAMARTIPRRPREAHMTSRSEIPVLAAGVILALAGVGLAAAHIAVPDYVTNGAVLMLGAGAGITIPGRPSSPSSSPSSTPTPAELAHAHAGASAGVTALADDLRAVLANAQVARPTSTPTPVPIAAPGQAE